jgi:hypothetical protein
MFTIKSMLYILKIQSYIMHAQARMRVHACFSLSWGIFFFLKYSPALLMLLHLLFLEVGQ